MAFYIDHGIMVLNAEAARSLLALADGATTTDFNTVSHISVKVASRLLSLAFDAENGLGQYLIGFQNNQLIMICHAATDILQVKHSLCMRSTSFHLISCRAKVSNAYTAIGHA